MNKVAGNMKLLNKKDYILLSLLAIFILISSSDYILNFFINDISLSLSFTITKSILLTLVLLTLVYFINAKSINLIKIKQQKTDNIKNKHNKLLQKIKYDYFFYTHKKDELFYEISDSIQTIFGYDKNEFIRSLQQYRITELTENVFQKVEPFAKESIIVPPFEIDIFAKNGDKLRFEIFETPILNQNGDIESIEVVAHNLHSHTASFLSENDSTYKRIFESSQSAILILKDNKFIESNSKALDVYDCTIEEITMASPFSSRFSPKFQPDGENSEEKAYKYIKQAFIKGTLEFEWVHLKRDSKEFLAEVSLTTFEYDQETYLLVTVQEKDDTLTINQEIIDKNDRLIKVFENFDDIFILVNKEKEILFYNKKFTHNPIFNKNVKYLSQLIDEAEFCSYIDSFIVNDDSFKIYKNVSIKEIEYDVKFIRNDENEFSIVLKNTKEENKIKNKKEELREIIESSRALLYKLNIDTGTYVYMSPSAKEITGYTYQEFLKFDNKQLKNLLHPNDLKNADNIIARFVKNISDINETSTLTYRFLHKSGEYRWFSDSYKIVEDKVTNSNYIIGNVYDITESIEAKRALQESEIRFRKTVENIQNGISIFENDKIIYVNDVLTEITGYSKNELLNLKSLRELAIEEEKERLEETFKNENVVSIEFWITTKNGKNICIQNRYSKSEITNELTAKYVITSDVTEKKRLEIALTEKDEVFWSMTNKMNEIIVECNEELELSFVNKAGLKKLNLIDLEQKTYVTEFVIRKEKEKIARVLKEVINGKEIKYVDIILLNNEQARMYPNLVTSQNSKSNVLRVIIVNENINLEINSDLKLTKESVDSVNNYNKVIINEIAKGLNKPINSIKNIIKLIEKTNLNEEQYNFLNTISESSDTLKSLINDIDKLRTSEDSNKLKSKFYLTNFLKETETEFNEKTKGEDVDLLVSKNFSKDFLLNANKKEIKLILSNILEISFSQMNKGIIELEFAITKKDLSYINLNFIIKNNGTVLSDYDVDKINNSIKKSDDLLNKQGENYKLCNTIRLIKNQYGEIEFYKGRKGKNIFNFNLIIEIIEENTEVNNNETEELKDINVLLVEDQPFNQMVIKTMMNNWDCSVDIAGNGVHAIKMLKESKYDIVLMDIFMPEMDGVETSKYIRNKLNNINSEIPIIAITGHIYDEIDDYKKYGFNGFINKPFTSKDLFNVMINSFTNKNEIKAINNKVNKSTNKFNLKVVDELTKGNKELKNKMINIFINKYNEDISELRTQIKNKNWERVYIISHGLKPSFNYMKVGKAEDYLFDILDLSKSKRNTEQIQNKLDLLENELKPIIDTLIAEVERN